GERPICVKKDCLDRDWKVPIFLYDCVDNYVVGYEVCAASRIGDACQRAATTRCYLEVQRIRLGHTRRASQQADCQNKTNCKQTNLFHILSLYYSDLTTRTLTTRTWTTVAVSHLLPF